jgi:hypothetical protein
VHGENALKKEYKFLRRICQEHFAVYGKHADRHENEAYLGEFSKPKKQSDPKSPS